MTKVIVKVQGQGGEGTTEIDAQAWSYMSPSVRVLYLHKHCRKATKGQPFDVVSVVKIEG
ncbi:hypothetical protein J2R95_003199 [Bradyrhizobium japonicum]|uniref:hypothetical protein n=1 Tax=Bradyrhizobium japonicum TaxID=375 RepID=UPI0020A07FFB|nr:hypothetical protein [Bradyrhizobium japonicum]MCP1937404.1 hypothetical protein [Bradyrhizobium japonicum]